MRAMQPVGISASPAAGTNVVDVYVNYLRKKLGAARSQLCGDMFGPDRVIETVRGEGYRMGGVRKMVASVRDYPAASAAFAGA